MNTSQPSPSTEHDALRAATPRIYTWISEKGKVIEQVRVVRKGDGLRASGHVVAAADEEHIAFSLSYEAEVDGSDELRRIALTSSTTESVRTIDLARDSEGAWLLTDTLGQRERVGAEGIRDVDVTYSVFFASLIVRRHSLHAQPTQIDERVLSVDSVTLDVAEDTVTFTSDDESIHGITATASTTATVDSDGVLVDVRGLSRRA